MACGSGGASDAAGVPLVYRTVAPAKVNLHLGVHPGRDERGYHRVDSLMCALDLQDEVQVSVGGAAGIRLECRPAATSDPRRNLAWRAAHDLSLAWGVDPAVDIRLTKAVPAQAGLGGGSSDAAAVLRCLAAAWGPAPAGAPGVGEVARGLGADVPFFLQDCPQLLGGAGDAPVRGFPMPGMSVALVRPDSGVSTAAAYRAFDEDPVPARDPSALCAALETGDARAVRENVSNNLERASSQVQPLVARTLGMLRALTGPGCAVLLCGSGSACAVLTPDGSEAVQIRDATRARGLWACATSTRSAPWADPQAL